MISRITKTLLLQEAWDVTRREIGQVPFKSSKISDPHIRAIVNQESKKTRISTAEIDAMIATKLAKIEELKKYSKLLYETVAKNAVESAVWEISQHLSDTAEFSKRRVTWDPITFNQLINDIQLENDEFFPLRGPYEYTSIQHISPLIINSKEPNPELGDLNKVTTAAATADGHFVFNKEFMQKLLDFAVVENLHPSGAKYQSNGGNIPDAYGYIEFLIIHELLHYSYGDMYIGKKMPHYNHNVHNIASDLRSNYMLVKNGLPQLPIGLFSDYINYDRQGSYEELCRVVKQELDKLPKNLQDFVNEFGEFDEHGESQDAPIDMPANPDQVHKDIEKKLAKGQQKAQDPTEKSKPSPSKPGDQEGRNKSGMEITGDRSAEMTMKSGITWQRLLKDLLSSSKIVTSTSFSKPHPRNVTGIALSQELGAAPAKPGPRTSTEETLKLFLLLDTSSSMYMVTPKVFAETKEILRILGKTDAVIGLGFFAGTAELYKINVVKDQYEKVSDLKDFNNKLSSQAKTGIDKLLALGRGGGTEFTQAIYANVSHILNNEFNVIIFSDNNIFWDSNWPYFIKLWQAHQKQVSFIADTRQTWIEACSKVQQEPRNWTYISNGN